MEVFGHKVSVLLPKVTAKSGVENFWVSKEPEFEITFIQFEGDNLRKFFQNAGERLLEVAKKENIPNALMIRTLDSDLPGPAKDPNAIYWIYLIESENKVGTFPLRCTATIKLPKGKLLMLEIRTTVTFTEDKSQHRHAMVKPIREKMIKIMESLKLKE